MIWTYKNLRLTALNAEQHARGCDYWYVITEGGTPHTAFKTKAGVLAWLNERGLSLVKVLTNPGVWGTQTLSGSYRDEMHLSADEVSRFDAIKPLVDSRTLSNGDYVEAKITLDPDGLRTVHTLNPNIRSRHVYSYAESREMMN